MNELKIFNNVEFGEIRLVEIQGKPYAVGIDITKALEYANPSKAIINHCKGITKLGIPSAGGIQETNVIPEGDIYRLIVKAADQSRNSKIKEKAERFERWIFDEVLPTIRKTGTYTISPHETDLQNQIEKAKKFISALDVTLEIFRRTNQGDSRQELSPALTLLSAYASAEVLNVLRATDRMGITKI